jgi:hypothetical protein
MKKYPSLIAGKASGKRKLTEVMEADLEGVQLKKQMQARDMASRFFEWET